MRRFTRRDYIGVLGIIAIYLGAAGCGVDMQNAESTGTAPGRSSVQRPNGKPSESLNVKAGHAGDSVTLGRGKADWIGIKMVLREGDRIMAGIYSSIPAVTVRVYRTIDWTFEFEETVKTATENRVKTAGEPNGIGLMTWKAPEDGLYFVMAKPVDGSNGNNGGLLLRTACNNDSSVCGSCKKRPEICPELESDALCGSFDTLWGRPQNNAARPQCAFPTEDQLSGEDSLRKWTTHDRWMRDNRLLKPVGSPSAREASVREMKYPVTPRRWKVAEFRHFIFQMPNSQTIDVFRPASQTTAWYLPDNDEIKGWLERAPLAAILHVEKIVLTPEPFEDVDRGGHQLMSQWSDTIFVYMQEPNYSGRMYLAFLHETGHRLHGNYLWLQWSQTKDEDLRTFERLFRGVETAMTKDAFHTKPKLGESLADLWASYLADTEDQGRGRLSNSYAALDTLLPYLQRAHDAVSSSESN